MMLFYFPLNHFKTAQNDFWTQSGSRSETSSTFTVWTLMLQYAAKAKVLIRLQISHLCPPRLFPRSARFSYLVCICKTFALFRSGSTGAVGPLHHGGHQGGVHGPGSGATDGDDGDSSAHWSQTGTCVICSSLKVWSKNTGLVISTVDIYQVRKSCIKRVFRLLLQARRTSTWSWIQGRNSTTASRSIFLCSLEGLYLTINVCTNLRK